MTEDAGKPRFVILDMGDSSSERLPDGRWHRWGYYLNEAGERITFDYIDGPHSMDALGWPFRADDFEPGSGLKPWSQAR